MDSGIIKLKLIIFDSIMSPQEESKQDVEQVKVPKDAGTSAKPKKNRKTLKIVALTVVAVLVLGGITAALVVRSIYNRPENVLAVALGDYLLDGEAKDFDATVSLSLEEAIMGVKDIDLKAGVQMSGKTTQIDLEVNASVITVSGALQSNENGNLYVKINDIPALLSSGVDGGALQAYGVSEEMAAQIASLDGKWIEIKPEDLTALTGQPAGSSEFDKCTDALYTAMDNEELGDSVDKLYKQNKFLLAKTATEEMVGDKELLKIEVGLDEAKFSAFAVNLSKSEQAKSVMDKCGLTDEEDSTEESAGDELKNGKLIVWVDRGKKELVKLEATGDSYGADDKKTMGMKLTMDVKEPAAKLEAPSDAVNIMTVVQSLGVDPAMLSGASQ